MKSLPRVSALINNYNYARFLPEALNSALSQDYPNLEVVVVDDGSTDDSVQIINQYAERYPNKIVPVFKANGGQASAYNAGVERATGDIFCFLDSDDVWLPRKVRTVVRAHRQHAFVHHPVLKNGQPNFIPRQPEYDRQYLLQRFGFEYVISPSSGLSIRRDLASQIFPIPESGLEICADIFMRLAATYLGGIGTVPQPLTFYRIHGKNLWFSFERSTLEKTKKFFEILDILNNLLISKSLDPIPYHYREMSGAMCLYLFGLSQKNIYVYGTGSMGTRIKKYLDYLNIPIAAFVDSSPDKWGQTIAERPVIAPDNLRNCSTNEIVIIGSSYEDEIRDILKKIQVPDSQVVNFPLAGAPVIWQS